uniref:Ig-like domain-containing protein n=1 Tax=Branchiostoma floridae TaxID=7739 RepID=C3ZRH3_BRAFL|eukprot:XP_002588762.1 hypothetical protein BRAFLDRAFT_89811 [Branchiostoma floridae]
MTVSFTDHVAILLQLCLTIIYSVQTAADLGRLHLSTASTGSQMHVVYSRGPLANNRTDFSITFTTRDNRWDRIADFNEGTFVPQTAPVFNHSTAKGFVLSETSYTYGGVVVGPFDWEYGYKTYSKTGDILELYVTIPDWVITDSDLNAHIPRCYYTSDTSTVLYGTVQFTVPGDSQWKPEEWPWIPFKSYEELEFNRTDGVIKYTFDDVKVGEHNADQNTVACEIPLGTLVTKLTVTACPIGRFGRFCAERCQCYNGASCHSFNGACRCAPGWRERNCTTVYPEMSISPSTSELVDLRYGEELQLTCTAYNLDVTNITWSYEGEVSDVILNITSSKNSSFLYIKSLLPEHEGYLTCVGHTDNGTLYSDTVEILIVCEDCACQSGGCPGPDSLLLAMSLSAAGLILLLLGAIFLLHRHNRLRVGNIDDPEVFQLGQNLQVPS